MFSIFAKFDEENIHQNITLADFLFFSICSFNLMSDILGCVHVRSFKTNCIFPFSFAYVGVISSVVTISCNLRRSRI